ncbi:MAG TPA: MATE family efflux transporter [Acetobacteraceae bacterium]
MPLIAAQLAAIGGNVVDVVLAGHLGAHVLGAVAVGTSLWGVAIMGMVGIMMALSPSVAQLDGAGRRGEVGPLFRQALWLALGLGIFAQTLVFFAGPAVVAGMGLPAGLAQSASGFLRAASFAAPALSLYLACRGLSEGLSMPRPSLVIGGIGLLAMVPIGYGLMYRLGLGALGSGMTSAISCWLQLGLFLAFMRVSPHYRRLGWGHGRRGPDLAAIGALLRLGVPMACSVLMEVGMFTASTLGVSRFGDAAVSSHQVALNIASVSFMVPLGLALAVTVRVGNAAGRRDHAGVRRAGMAGLSLTLATQSLSCAAMLAVPVHIVRLYTADPLVLSGAVALLYLAALFQMSDGVQVVCNGALRGLKDARVPMLITGLAYWGVGLPVGWFLAFGMRMQTIGMWAGLVAGLSVAAILLLTRFLVLSRRPILGIG